jgi:hypothetical protein
MQQLSKEVSSMGGTRKRTAINNPAESAPISQRPIKIKRREAGPDSGMLDVHESSMRHTGGQAMESNVFRLAE